MRTRLPGPLLHDSETLEPAWRRASQPKNKPLCPCDTVAHGPLCCRSRTAVRCGPLLKDTSATGPALCPSGEPPLDDLHLGCGQHLRRLQTKQRAGTTGQRLVYGEDVQPSHQRHGHSPRPQSGQGGFQPSGVHVQVTRRLRTNEGVHLHVGSKSARKCDVKGTSRLEVDEDERDLRQANSHP